MSTSSNTVPGLIEKFVVIKQDANVVPGWDASSRLRINPAKTVVILRSEEYISMVKFNQIPDSNIMGMTKLHSKTMRALELHVSMSPDWDLQVRGMSERFRGSFDSFHALKCLLESAPCPEIRFVNLGLCYPNIHWTNKRPQSETISAPKRMQEILYGNLSWQSHVTLNRITLQMAGSSAS
ncbi:hypothetical protein QAD02_002150 [Eretmocerus hayati]|uniref:Uncharacterized protein n=1 Tax=Eretmocerus hayati TaxID=131215 RepID=A0ACC2NIZ5_9HYME|nr:hypothetical protein QAD02_002150 [Eretmocerus hayati]